MFAIRAFGGWVSYHLEPLRDPRPYPGYAELLIAEDNASYVVRKLNFFRSALESRVPHHIDVVRLIDKTLEALRDDHGGVLPDNALGVWWGRRKRAFADGQIFTEPGEREAMVKIYERWKNLDRFKQKLWALYLSEDDQIFYKWDPCLSEKHILQLKRCLGDWLQERKAGQAGQAY